MKKKLMLLLFFSVLSLSACGQKNTQELTEETAVSDEVPERTETEGAIEETVEDAETEDTMEKTVEDAEIETEEASDTDSITPEVSADFSRTYQWGIMEFEGEDSLVMEVELKGSPRIPGSTISFRVLESIFDYKLFEKITCGELVVDKETYPDWATDGLTDGIFGFVDDGFTLTMDEEQKEEALEVTFSYPNNKSGEAEEYTITWKSDGTAEVNEGSLIEE
ncbi:MAG: hypothetical protein K6E91_00170 [Butyrivibrio sp.]|nr:hypothetical protein [Butyrivibrio sp.]